MRSQHTSVSWSFRWDRDSVTQFELSWVFERHEWQQRSAHDTGGWSSAIVVAGLSEPQDEENARQIADEYAARA